MLRAGLICHPDSMNPAVRRIEASVARSAGGVLAVVYRLQGNIGQLRVPAWTGCAAGERLWEHTCFETFISRPGASVYHELNFAPSGAWAAYAFARYREGSPLADTSLDPRIAVRRGEGTVELEASIPLERLLPDYAGGPLALGLSAVIEDRQGGLSYWALAHPGSRPDFHHRDSFVLKMDPGSSPG